MYHLNNHCCVAETLVNRREIISSVINHKAAAAVTLKTGILVRDGNVFPPELWQVKRDESREAGAVADACQESQPAQKKMIQPPGLTCSCSGVNAQVNPPPLGSVWHHRLV